MICRPGCGACCIAMSISSSIPGTPGMPDGKPAGVPCIQLMHGKCLLFGKADRPKVCISFPATPDVCGASCGEAFRLITRLENLTKPEKGGEKE